MSQDKQFLVSGALLECPYGTQKTTLQGMESNASLQIGNELFLSTTATKKEQNIVSFGKCKYKEEEDVVCGAQMDLAEEWLNPATASRMLTIQTDSEAIHKDARLLCIYGRTYIRAVTTGQKELTETEKKFIRYMQENFGFDEEVILIMLKVIYAIDKEYPNETEQKKAWRFARLMGGFTYSYGEEDRFIEIRDEAIYGIDVNFKDKVKNEYKQMKDILKWWATAGFFTDPLGINYSWNEEKDEEQLQKYFTNTLGIKESEYHKLRFHVMAQHEITSRPLHTFPGYMNPDSQEDEQNVYREVWLKIYSPNYYELNNGEREKITEEFKQEWNRLYNKFIELSQEEKERLAKDKKLFEIYSDIERKNNVEKEPPYSPKPYYTDFSHQQILIATHTVESHTVDTMGGLMVGSITMVGKMVYLNRRSVPYILDAVEEGVEKGREIEEWIGANIIDLAGWLGDIWLADSKITSDDYKADLDGVNISNIIIHEEMGTIEAITEYYEILESGETTREEDFVRNIGNGDINEGLKYLENQSIFMSIFASIFGEEEKVKNGTEAFNIFMSQLQEGL